MLYYLFEYLDKTFDLPGAGVFQYITFRSAMALILSLMLSTIFGKKVINFLRNQQVGETVRELGLEGQTQKAGTPTMGGLIIIFATLIPVLLFTKLDNIYIILLVVTTLWMGTIGFVDDYIKIFKKDKQGLKGIFKVIGQVGLGLIVGSVLYFSPAVTIREKSAKPITFNQTENIIAPVAKDIKSTTTSIPFTKNNELDYAKILEPFTDDYQNWAWLVFIPIVIFIITAVSNGANLTDGIDGLAAGTSAISVIALGIFTFVSGNLILSSYLNIMFIPNSGEMTVFIAAFVGSLIGFLWYNSYPASVFMGDTGSLTIGGIIAVLAISVRKEMLLPLFCAIFFAESASVIIQVTYFKYTKKRFGEGRRIFLMSPLHHHYQKKGYHESKIVTRFWVVTILFTIVSIVTLKLR
ncbi:phospho-N-acetylmuramoyl-pentapeptide-transferase [Flavobacterium sp.]|jgi:phospho-N-acetylmuramoyl-pentapeptide-transferase|uniref:phospho-N-acetylmuramoyl-pentapeptide- transferase n=1 Tax=Flavobacterium sp. TaxID=239 RepID=UPI0037C17E0C